MGLEQHSKNRADNNGGKRRNRREVSQEIRSSVPLIVCGHDDRRLRSAEWADLDSLHWNKLRFDALMNILGKLQNAVTKITYTELFKHDTYIHTSWYQNNVINFYNQVTYNLKFLTARSQCVVIFCTCWETKEFSASRHTDHVTLQSCVSLCTNIYTYYVMWSEVHRQM